MMYMDPTCWIDHPALLDVCSGATVMAKGGKSVIWIEAKQSRLNEMIETEKGVHGLLNRGASFPIYLRWIVLSCFVLGKFVSLHPTIQSQLKLFSGRSF
jgi:hypothetical protein